ncbi:myrcene synthase, chloroplastic-like [Neltuma alba]|uniref:myrcene synthase, chloroplastic-like n=1 Tax=Neltuma alba TaxID=207710 RepID=UPI0010A31FD3|nr:myrcene synthase, chloroplastic-like [Prosopis alba]
MLLKLENAMDQLDLIDILQRFGVDHHFGLEIRNIIEKIYKNKDQLKRNNNLYAMARDFRILRQHGYDVSPEVFKGFLDDKGNFHSSLSVDRKGMLSLHEALFLSTEGDMILDEARDFSSAHLKEWWERIGFGEKSSFSRDRIVENFMWTVLFAEEPQFGYYRTVATQVNALITTIDDVYDVHGELEELEIFTQVVDRWDINAIDSLPEHMKIRFLAIYNFVNEVAFDILKGNGHNIIRHLKKWADLCKSYLVEAKWYCGGYQPSLNEYLENARISIGAPIIVVHAFVVLSNSIVLDSVGLGDYYDLIHSLSIILRLANDLRTSKREKETVMYLNQLSGT